MKTSTPSTLLRHGVAFTATALLVYAILLAGLLAMANPAGAARAYPEISRHDVKRIVLAEARANGNAAAVHEEIGDLLFAVANLARQAGVDAEGALRDANVKFTRRFHYVEERCRQDGIAPADAGLERLDAYWNEIRAADKG